MELRSIHPDDGDALAAIGKLRVKVWRDYYGNFSRMDKWLDDFDALGSHWVIMNDVGRIVAAARLTTHNYIEEMPEAESYTPINGLGLVGPFASINRLVVDADYQKLGLARWLDETRIDYATVVGCRYVIGSTPSGNHRVRQLLGQGFSIAGPGEVSRFQSDMGVVNSPVILVKDLMPCKLGRDKVACR